MEVDSILVTGPLLVVCVGFQSSDQAHRGCMSFTSVDGLMPHLRGKKKVR